MTDKILIIEGDPAYQRLLREILEADGNFVRAASDGAEGLRMWTHDAPTLILMDVHLPDMDGSTLMGKIRASLGPARQVAIMMLLKDQDVEQKIQLLLAGADDCLIKPPDLAHLPEELLVRVHNLLARPAPGTAGRPAIATTEQTEPPRRAPGRVLALYGAKGGVGTTSLAVNAAIALKRDLSRSVCLMDGNFQFGAHRIFMDRGRNRKSIVDIVTASGIDEDVIRPALVKYYSGIDLLLAPPSPEEADLIHSEALATIIDCLRHAYDYVLIDVGRQLDDSSTEIMDHADQVFIVMTADLLSLYNVGVVLRTLGRLGHGPEKIKLILNRSTAASGIAKGKAEKALGRSIDYTVVNDYRTATGAVNAGTPFMFTKPNTPLGRSVLDLARGMDASPVPVEADSGLGARIAGWAGRSARIGAR